MSPPNAATDFASALAPLLADGLDFDEFRLHMQLATDMQLSDAADSLERNATTAARKAYATVDAIHFVFDHAAATTDSAGDQSVNSAGDGVHHLDSESDVAPDATHIQNVPQGCLFDDALPDTIWQSDIQPQDEKVPPDDRFLHPSSISVTINNVAPLVTVHATPPDNTSPDVIMYSALPRQRYASRSPSFST